MDIRQLRYFIRVAELGSFSRAADVLGIGQPSLSRQVRQLEVELRQNLLVRNGRGAEPTEAGKVLLELGRGILHQMERVYEELGRVQGNLAGRVSVGLPPTWARSLVLPFTRLLQRELPNATLAVTEGLTVRLRDAVLHGNVDMALLYDALPTPELELLPVGEEELYLVSRAERTAGSRAPVSLEELAALPLVMPACPNAIRMLLERELCAAGLRPRLAYEVDGVPSILDLVRDGAGHALLPMSSVTGPGASGGLECRPVQPALKAHLMLAVSARRPATQTQRAAFRLLVDLVRSHDRPPCPEGIAASGVMSYAASACC